MKTKDLIKKLQEADPSGELHVRVRGYGEPVGAGAVPGYWDGPFHYTTEGDGLVITDKDNKVDLFCEDVDDFIWDQNGRTDNILVDLQGKDRTRNTQEYVLKTGMEAKESHDRVMGMMKDRVFSEMAAGWKIVQSSSYDVKLCHKQWYVKDPDKFVECDEPGQWREDTKNQKKLCQGECQVVLYSGLFSYRPEGRLIHWDLKEVQHV